MATIEELEKRIATLESNSLKLARKVFGDTIREVKIGLAFKCQPGERISTGGYISGVEHKQGKKGPWQSFKLAGSDGKGVYAKHFAEWPTWAAQGIACVVEEMEIDTYNGKNTYTIRKWRPYMLVPKPQPEKRYEQPAIQYQAPLPVQTFAEPDPEVDENIPF